MGDMSASTRKGVVGGRSGDGPRSARSPIGIMIQYKKQKKKFKKGNKKGKLNLFLFFNIWEEKEEEVFVWL